MKEKIESRFVGQGVVSNNPKPFMCDKCGDNMSHAALYYVDQENDSSKALCTKCAFGLAFDEPKILHDKIKMLEDRVSALEISILSLSKAFLVLAEGEN